MARMLSVVYSNCDGALPHYITILQDNCQRECKNQKMLLAIIKLKILGALPSYSSSIHLSSKCSVSAHGLRPNQSGVVDVISLAFPQKGHTHGPLDATGGQAVVKCSNSEFSSANELTAIYAARLYLKLGMVAVFTYKLKFV